MVEVFKTNVEEVTQSKIILDVLGKTFPSFALNFDLEDCDRILRVEGENILPLKIIAILNTNGYECEILE